MKDILVSLGLALLLGVGALIVTIIFIEGWGAGVSIGANAVAFFIAGYFTGKIKPKCIYYSGLIILIPFWIVFVSDIHYFSDLFKYLSSPSRIDSRNFFFLLPVIALASAYLGS